MTNRAPHPVHIIDVSLRDGGYPFQFNLNESVRQALLSHLNASKIDAIEVGYRNGPRTLDKQLGVSAWCPEHYLKTCRKQLTQSKLVVMAHAERLNRSDLEILKQCQVDLLRLCLIKDNQVITMRVLAACQSIGLATAVNVTRISEYPPSDRLLLIKQLAACEPQVIYLADSLGAMAPQQVEQLFKQCQPIYPNRTGFHAHDNLGLAQANSLAALEAGAHYLDCSLAGLGKGVGNLRTELFIAYLNACGDRHIQLPPLVTAANLLRQYQALHHPELELSDLTRHFPETATSSIPYQAVDASS